jgi:hypothetical protein
MFRAKLENRTAKDLPGWPQFHSRAQAVGDRLHGRGIHNHELGATVTGDGRDDAVLQRFTDRKRRLP